MTIADAQTDLRRAYVGGGPGLVVSGLFWLLTYVVLLRSDVELAYITLFITGMLIFPSGIILRSLVFRRRKEASDNPLGRVALESTIAMIMGLILGWLIIPYQPDWAFPFAAIAVGTHFFAFRTAYGDSRFWLLAVILTALGFITLAGFLPLGSNLVAAFGVTEILFGIWLTTDAMRDVDVSQE